MLWCDRKSLVIWAGCCFKEKVYFFLFLNTCFSAAFSDQYKHMLICTEGLEEPQLCAVFPVLLHHEPCLLWSTCRHTFCVCIPPRSDKVLLWAHTCGKFMYAIVNLCKHKLCLSRRLVLQNGKCATRIPSILPSHKDAVHQQGFSPLASSNVMNLKC